MMFDFFGRKAKKENERLKAENARLTAENAYLRPLAEEGRENRELADSFMGRESPSKKHEKEKYMESLREAYCEYTWSELQAIRKQGGSITDKKFYEIWSFDMTNQDDWEKYK